MSDASRWTCHLPRPLLEPACYFAILSTQLHTLHTQGQVLQSKQGSAHARGSVGVKWCEGWTT